MPLFHCVIKRGKEHQGFIISANTKRRIRQLLKDYLVDRKAKLEITEYK